jgi:hypothetical protein
MRRFMPLIALGLGAYLAFVISAFPAETALRWFAPPNLRTSNVSGTIWSGSAQLASIEAFAFRDLTWDIDALPLLLARLGGTAQARLSNGFVDTRFAVSREQIRLRDLQLSTSIAAISTAVPVSGANGALSAQFRELLLERIDFPGGGPQTNQDAFMYWPIIAAGSVRVSDLIVEPYAGLGNQLIPLGNFELEFSETSQSAIAAQIRDLGGPLDFNGTLRLTPQLEYSLEGQVATRPDASESLTQGLSFMTSEPGPDGKRTLALAGSL